MSTPPNERGRPGEKAAHSEKSQTATDSMVPPSEDMHLASTRVGTGRRYWARQLIERQTSNRPMYGSTSWLMLPNDHPDKIAACVVAAECWAQAGDTLEDDLKREIEAFQLGFKHGEDTEYQRRAQEHREWYDRPGPIKSFMERRAEQLAAAQPRPDDYTGGPVTWDGGDGA